MSININTALVSPNDIDFIINHGDGTSTVKYVKGAAQRMPTKDAEKLAVVLNRDLKTKQKHSGIIR